MTTTEPPFVPGTIASNRANFDRLAQAYRWLEYASLGRTLERARSVHLAALAGSQRALILGDGDGRFTAELLRTQPHLKAEAVDSSKAMLRELLRNAGPAAASRLSTQQADVRDFIPGIVPDVIATHFLLDCLTQAEADALIARLASALPVGGLWLVSEFRIPAGPLHWPARAYIRLLYLAFRVLTGLKVNRVPDFATALSRNGLQPVAVHHSLRGLLTSELWRRI